MKEIIGDNYDNLKGPCQPSTRPMLHTSRTWQPCGICSTLRKSINMNLPKTCSKEISNETRMNMGSPRYELIEELETSPCAAKNKYLCKSPKGYLNPFIECQSHEEGCHAILPSKKSDERGNKIERVFSIPFVILALVLFCFFSLIHTY